MSVTKKRRRKKAEEPLTEQIKRVSKSKVKEKKIQTLPTGCTILDLVTGGYQYGIINVVGDTSTGKTYLTIETLAYLIQVKGKKVKWFYDKAEGRFSFNTKKMYGYDMLTKDMESRKSKTTEDMSFNLRKELETLKTNEILVYIVDSLDGLSSDDEVKRDNEKYKKKAKGEKLEKGTYGMSKAKNLSEFFRLRSNDIGDKKCLLIFISQVRDNISLGFGPKYRRQGGKGLDHYSNNITWLAIAQKHKRKGRTIGSTIKIQATKASNDKPFREGFIELVFDYGVDNILTNINFLYDLKTEKGQDKDNAKTKKLLWDGKDYTRSQLIKYIEDSDLENDLSERVIEKWDAIEKSISSEGRKSKWEK